MNKPELQKKLDRIKQPPTPPEKADPKTELEIQDVRQHPVIETITKVVLSIGLLLIAASSAMCWYISTIEDGVGSLSDNTTGSMLAGSIENLTQVQELFCGLGVELFASAMMLRFFLFLSKRCKSESDHIENVTHSRRFSFLKFPFLKDRLFWGLTGGILLCVFPLWMPPWFFFSTVESIGIEVMGALIIFALLDNVQDLLKGDNPK